MKSRTLLFVLLLAFGLSCLGQETGTTAVKLPAPRMTGGKPLMEALKERKTGRSFLDKPLDQQMLSDLLWAAYGVNRPESGKRTAPSAMNKQEVTIYVSLKEGTYTYNATENTLEPAVAGDNRAKMGIQSFAGEAAVVLTYVADLSKTAGTKESADMYSGADVGFISQNVYLYCASEGLSTVVMGYISRDKISDVLSLSKDMKPVFSQCVGYPAEE
jgi:SagB-type dehydrogenase family enzyme